MIVEKKKYSKDNAKQYNNTAEQKIEIRVRKKLVTSRSNKNVKIKSFTISKGNSNPSNLLQFVDWATNHRK